jgi:hypothetical protein
LKIAIADMAKRYYQAEPAIKGTLALNPMTSGSTAELIRRIIAPKYLNKGVNNDNTESK